jgi:hypothetical protein
VIFFYKLHVEDTDKPVPHYAFKKDVFRAVYDVGYFVDGRTRKKPNVEAIQELIKKKNEQEYTEESQTCFRGQAPIVPNDYFTDLCQVLATYEKKATSKRATKSPQATFNGRARPQAAARVDDEKSKKSADHSTVDDDYKAAILRLSGLATRFSLSEADSLIVKNVLRLQETKSSIIDHPTLAAFSTKARRAKFLNGVCDDLFNKEQTKRTQVLQVFLPLYMMIEPNGINFLCDKIAEEYIAEKREADLGI